MAADTASEIFEKLHVAGLNLSLAHDGGLAVAPSGRLTDDLRAIIRSSKALLIDWLTGTNNAASELADAPENPLDWTGRAAAYHAHHFNCPTCIAAGRGSRYGQRCVAGIALWRTYCD